jgi:hypothetical protein
MNSATMWLLAACLQCASANIASPEAYDVTLCGGGNIQVQLVGSAGASFEIYTADGYPIVRTEPDEGDCATYVYASVTDAGEIVASTQAVNASLDMGDHDYHADLKKLSGGLLRTRTRRQLDLDPVPVPIPIPLPSGDQSVMRNLVVLVRFADHVDRCLPSVADMDKLFNSDTYTYDASGVPVRATLFSMYVAVTLRILAPQPPHMR